tara:strand:- start:222 stop:548 length:327 start_codon:yes stop_codon:yes gene_type:complete
MRIIKNILLIITLSLFIISCSNGLQGFKLKKTTSGDEFLIQKKDPLVQPPDYSKLPNPDEENNNFDNEETQIEKVFKNNNSDNNEENQDSKKSETSLEKNILKKIQNQ